MSYIRGLLPQWEGDFWSSFLPPIVDLFELAISLSLQWFLNPFDRKDRGDLDLHIHQSKSPLCEGIPLALDLGDIWRTWCSFPCSSSLIPPIAFVALVEFESEGLAIAFDAYASVWVLGEDSVGWKMRSFLLLGSWNPSRFSCFAGLWCTWGL